MIVVVKDCLQNSFLSNSIDFSPNKFLALLIFEPSSFLVLNKITMFLILIFGLGFVSVICHMPTEFRRFIESKLVLHREDYPLYKQPLKSSIKSIFSKKPAKSKLNVNQTTEKPINVDGAMHYKISKNHPKFSKVQDFETNYRNLLGMKGFKYIYKRDMYWRTWRQVEDEASKKKILFYRAENSKDRTCAACHNRGYWVCWF